MYVFKNISTALFEAYPLKGNVENLKRDLVHVSIFNLTNFKCSIELNFWSKICIDKTFKSKGQVSKSAPFESIFTKCPLFFN